MRDLYHEVRGQGDVSMKSGLGDRNNEHRNVPRTRHPVSMKSGLGDRNNPDPEGLGLFPPERSQ